MKNMIILFLFMSMMFILATNSNEIRNVAQQDHLDKYFTEYTNRYFFAPDNNADQNAATLKKQETSKSILSKPIKDLGLL